FGRGRELNHFLFVLVQDVVNGALVVNGSVLVGNRLVSCLVGHVPVKEDGPVCNCGRRGCVNAFASDGALVNEAKVIAAKHGSPLAVLAAGRPVDKPMIIEAALAGDAECQQLLRRQASYLGKGIASAVNTVDVEAVVLAMNLDSREPAGEFAEVDRAYRRDIRVTPDYAPAVLPTKLKGELSLLGPATLAIRQVFSPRLTIQGTASKRAVASLSAAG
ncbi:MAG: ROK family protein, partial [Chloroflexota bacterium]